MKNKAIYAVVRHALTLPLTLGFDLLFYHKDVMQFVGIGLFARICLATFVAFIVACIVEWYQGTKGANKTPEERKDMYNDIVISTVSGLLGVGIAELIINI